MMQNSRYTNGVVREGPLVLGRRLAEPTNVPRWLLVAVGLLVCLWFAALAWTWPEKDKLPDALTFPPRSGFHLILPYEAIDGDTVRFYWLVPDVGRLHGINAPELKSPGGKEAKDFLTKLLPGKPCAARVLGREKYGRALLELIVDGKSVGQAMIDGKYAKPYDGRGPRP